MREWSDRGAAHSALAVKVSQWTELSLMRLHITTEIFWFLFKLFLSQILCFYYFVLKENKLQIKQQSFNNPFHFISNEFHPRDEREVHCSVVFIRSGSVSGFNPCQ